MIWANRGSVRVRRVVSEQVLVAGLLVRVTSMRHFIEQFVGVAVRIDFGCGFLVIRIELVIVDELGYDFGTDQMDCG